MTNYINHVQVELDGDSRNWEGITAPYPSLFLNAYQDITGTCYVYLDLVGGGLDTSVNGGKYFSVSADVIPEWLARANNVVICASSSLTGQWRSNIPGDYFEIYFGQAGRGGGGSSVSFTTAISDTPSQWVETSTALSLGAVASRLSKVGRMFTLTATLQILFTGTLSIGSALYFEMPTAFTNLGAPLLLSPPAELVTNGGIGYLSFISGTGSTSKYGGTTCTIGYNLPSRNGYFMQFPTPEAYKSGDTLNAYINLSWPAAS